MTDHSDDVPSAPSPRLSAALASAKDRRERRSRRLRPVLWGIVAAIAVRCLYAAPRPGLHGTHLAVSVLLACCLLLLALAASGWWQITTPLSCALFCVGTAGSGLALGVFQPSSMSVLPPSVAMLTAFLVLRRWHAVVLSGAIAGGLVAAELVAEGVSIADLSTELLFCAVLVLMAISMRQAGQSEERAGLLLAQLEDARQAEAEAAAVAERTRIAQDLHDVLAQTLSGLAVHVQAARRMAKQEGAGADLQDLLNRTGGLVKDGLDDARRAVGALRGDRTPSLYRLEKLVERYRTDLELDVTLSISGRPRALSADADLALYRGAQEALTNATRYAREASITVTLCYEESATVLTVEDRRSAPSPAPSPLAEGSGLGLRGMRERLQAAGGRAGAGPTPHGWTVKMEVPE